MMRIKFMRQRVIALFLNIAMLVSIGISPAAAAGNFSPRARDQSDSDLVKQAERAAAQNGMRQWYRQPAQDWESQGLVIGNGFFGSVLFGGVEKDRIHLNEKTLWAGGPTAADPEGAGTNCGNRTTPVSQETIKNNQKQLEAAEFNNSGGNIQDMWSPNLGFKGNYLDFADLYVDFAPSGHTQSGVSDYVRDLDFNTGVSSVSYAYAGTRYLRDYFASYLNKVQVFRFSADSMGKQSFDLSMTSVQGGAITAEGDTITLRGAVSNNGLVFEGQVKVVADGGTVTVAGNQIQVRNADAVTIYQASGTDYKNDFPTYRGEDPHEEITTNVENAAKLGYHAVRQAHIADHYGLFSRVSLDVGAGIPDRPTDEVIQAYRKGDFNSYLDVLVFQFGRYLTIAGSREGALPSNLQGMWGVGNMEWSGDYHFNVNVQMNYWPAFNTNLAECGKSYVEYLDTLREPGRITAYYTHGVGDGETSTETGWMVHTGSGPFAMTAPGSSQEWGWNMGGAPWALQNAYDYYRFTGDKDYMASTIYPMMREQTIFWDEYLIRSPKQDNRWVVSPSISAEQGPTSIGSTYDQSLVWQLYKETLEASKILGVDEALRADWQDKMDGLKPIQIGNQGQIKEWYDEGDIGKLTNGAGIWNFNAGGAEVHRHCSQLIGLYPGNLINETQTTWMDAARVSLEDRGFETTTGWSKAHRLNLWARTGDGDKSYRMVQSLLSQGNRGMMDNLLDSHGSHSGSLASSAEIFQIEGNYGYTAGVAEMLLQSDMRYIQPLPAIPTAWPSGSVKGLVARGNFVCDMDWAANKLSAMTVTSNVGGECVIDYPGIGSAAVSGTKVTKLTADRISFQTVKGGVYTLSNLPGAAAAALQTPVNAAAYRTADNAVALCWNAVPGATMYNVYREKLKTVPAGRQSAGSVYGEGYVLVDATETPDFTDTDVSADSICHYMISAVTEQGESSCSAPVGSSALNMADAVATAKRISSEMTSSQLAVLKKELNAVIAQAEALRADASVAQRAALYKKLTELSEKCGQMVTLPQLLDEAAAVLERAQPGKEEWRCPAAIFTALHSARQDCQVLLDTGADGFETAQLAAFIKTLRQAKDAANAATGQLTVTATLSEPTATVGAKLTMTPTVENPRFVIHYTLDGTLPTAASPVYEGTLTVQEAGGIRLNAQLFLNGNPIGGMHSRSWYGGDNLSLGKTATSLTPNWGADYGPSKVIDGNMGTRWAVRDGGTSHATLDIDLGESLALGFAVVREAAFTNRLKSFEILVSDNGSAWKQVFYTDKAQPNTICALDDGAAGRYVRYRTVQTSNEINIGEVELYGQAAAKLDARGEAALACNKTELLPGESLLAQATMVDAAGLGVPPGDFTVTYVDDDTQNVTWEDGKLTVAKGASASFEIWAICEYRGKTYETARQTVHVKEVAADGNLALNEPISAAFERPAQEAKYAVDGYLSSRWDTYQNAAATMPPNLWYEIAFRRAETFDTIELEEFTNYSKAAKDTQTITGFLLETSNDGKNWERVFVLTPEEMPESGYVLAPLDTLNEPQYGAPSNPDGSPNHQCTVDKNGKILTATHHVTLAEPVSARYLRLTVTNVVPGSGTGGKANVSLHEFRVKNSASDALVMSVGTPLANRPSSVFENELEITLAAEEGAQIYYTLDGTLPTAASARYDAPIKLTEDAALQAVAIADGLAPSAVASYHYRRKSVEEVPPEEPVTVQTPRATPSPGNYDEMQTVTLFGGDGASMRYTTDGTDPSETAGALYTGPIKLARSRILRVMAYGSGQQSEIAEFVYALKLRQPPALISGLTLDRISLSMTAGESTQLVARTQPDGRAPSLQWSSSDSSVAHVDQNGVVHGYGEGTATITSAVDGEKTASCLVFVTGELPRRPSTPTEKPEEKPSALPAEEKFSDVNKTDWFLDAVQWALDQGLMNGTSETTFAPQAASTRAMVLTMLYRQAGSPNATDSTVWFEDAAKWAVGSGISDGTNLTVAITREQLATMLWRYADSPKVDSTKLRDFTDSTKISVWAEDAVAWAVEAGILNGKGSNNLDPLRTATRAETAAMLMRFCEKQ